MVKSMSLMKGYGIPLYVTKERRGLKMKKKEKKIIFISWFLFSIMLFFFGPIEIFYGNSTEFEFVLADFFVWILVLSVVIAIIGSLLTYILPYCIQQVILGVVFGIDIAGYIQVMFVNKNLDLLGLNPEGYVPPLNQVVPNLILWIVCISGMILLLFCKEKIGRGIVLYLGGLLIAVQLVALFSLVILGKKDVIFRNGENWSLSGTEQYTVSTQDNVILLVLDYFSNEYLEGELEQYPDALDFLHDFTYYSNADCTYFGTYPSMNHMLTGYELDPTQPINEWFVESWTNDRTAGFYKDIQKQGYKVNVYTPDPQVLVGTNNIEMLSDVFSNVKNLSTYVEVNTGMIVKTMIKMSCYRIMPYVIKPYFYTGMGEYTGVVRSKDDWIRHQNYDFKQGLEEKGIETDSGSKYLIVQHLMGAHEYNNTENGDFSEENTSREETIRGCLTVTKMYLDALQEAGVYDSATIIITADHGGYEKPYYQPIFYIKLPNEFHEYLYESSAPISHSDLLGTLALATGIEGNDYGHSIFDFDEQELRERVFWLRTMDEKYSKKKCYSEDRDGTQNIYKGYRYIGNNDALIQKIDNGPDYIIEMNESYY